MENDGSLMHASERVSLPDADRSSYVDWPAVFAGVVVALALAFVLLTFGASAGLASVSPWTSTRSSVIAVSLGAGFWMILVHIWAFGLGGYFAGRMRHRNVTATVSPAGAAGAFGVVHTAPVHDEVAFRDGAHGAVVWGLAITAGAIVAALVAGFSSRGNSDALGSRVSAVDPISIATDTLLRTTRPPADGRADEARQEIGRMLVRAPARAAMAPSDRSYLAELVMARTGIAPADATRRVDETLVQLTDALNRARRTSVILGFVTAATLLLGAAAAWWGATVGGQHRDENTVWAGFAKHASGTLVWNKS